jgi:hypothetical protein
VIVKRGGDDHFVGVGASGVNLEWATVFTGGDEKERNFIIYTAQDAH